MESYFEDYTKIIYKGLQSTIVTNLDGQEINVSDGLEIWAAKANEIQKNTKGLLFFCGNGASAAMAEHMSHDWFQNGVINTYSVSETSHLTAISNDLSYEDVFSYRVDRICTEKDMLIAISSSGNSSNIIKAIEAAVRKRTYVITVSGKNADNKIRQMGDLNFYVPLDTYGYVESAHAVLTHAALDCFLDKYMGGKH